MATRYIGGLKIKITYQHPDTYAGSIYRKADGQRLALFSDLHPPHMGFPFASDSAKAYDEMAGSAVSFLSYYTTHNRGDDVPDWAPEPEVCDEIDSLGCEAIMDDSTYRVTR